MSKKNKSVINVQEFGLFTFTNGDKFEGEYLAEGKSKTIVKHGKGIYTTWDGQIYNGIWDNDKIVENIDIEIKYPDNNIYKGLVTNNLEYFNGKYMFYDQSFISGNFDENLPKMDSSIYFDKCSRKWNILVLDENIFLRPFNRLFRFDNLKKKEEVE